MSTLSRTILVILLSCLPALAQAQRTVVLVTIGPGDAVWEKFGHNMIEIRGDAGFGEDIAYNWGLFDFDQPNFVWRFIQGRMQYTMGAMRSVPYLEEYRQQNRTIVCQELRLTDQQIEELIARCEINRQPEHADYRYDYFRDNCSTRVRDMLEKVLPGQVRQTLDQAKPSRPMSYRQHAMRLMQDDFWLSLGTDFVLGPRTDAPLSAWDETFMPAKLAEYMSPLATRTWSPWTSTRPPEPQLPPDRRLPLLLAGAIIGGVMLLTSQFARRHRAIRICRNALLTSWWIIGAIGSVLMLYLWLFTDHEAAYMNLNLLPYSPLAIVALVYFSRRRAQRLHGVALAALIVCVIALVGNVTGFLRQDNLAFILLALPIQFAVWQVVRRLTRGTPTGQVSAP